MWVSVCVYVWVYAVALCVQIKNPLNTNLLSKYTSDEAQLSSLPIQWGLR